LARHGVKLELGLETLDGHGLDGQKVEEQRAVGTGGQRNELALVALRGLDVLVNLYEVCGLAAHGRTVIYDFDLQFSGSLIDDGHKTLRDLTFVSAIQLTRQCRQLRGGQPLPHMSERSKEDGVHT